MIMYEAGKKYKIVFKTSFYTVNVIDEDTEFIKCIDKYGRELILNKKDISSARIVKEYTEGYKEDENGTV